MPKLSEMVEAEAARAESEEDENGEPEPVADEGQAVDEDEAIEEAAEDAEGQQEPAQPQAVLALGPDEIRKAERARESYRKRIGDILGAEAVTHECPVCAGLGYLSDLPPDGTSLTFVTTEAGPEIAFAPPESAPEYVDAPDKQGCDWCEGHGFVRSGSKNPNAAVVPCSKCNGNGWVTKAVAEPSPAAMPAVAGAPVPPPMGEQNGVGPDAWGRPAGHQHWGVPPAMIPG